MSLDASNQDVTTGDGVRDAAAPDLAEAATQTRDPAERNAGLDRPVKNPNPRRRTLPSWTPWAALGAAVVIMAAVQVVLGGNPALFVVGAVVLTAFLTWLTSRVVEGRRKAVDRVVTVAVVTAFATALVPLVSLLYTVVKLGSERFDAAFFTQSMTGVLGDGGGIYHALFGTLIISGIATLISVPIGLLTAIYLVEYAGDSRLAKAVTFFVDVMTGIPSIVAGLFAYSVFAMIFGPGVRFGLVGAVALSVLMIPIVVRSTEEMLRVVPDSLREAAFALGVPRWRTIVKVVLPTSIAGIMAGVTLAIARIMGETAPLLVTVGVTTGVNLNPFENRQATLPVFAYFQYSFPGVPPEPYVARAWATALLLIIIVMSLNLVARFIARAFAPKSW